MKYFQSSGAALISSPFQRYFREKSAQLPQHWRTLAKARGLARALEIESEFRYYLDGRYAAYCVRNVPFVLLRRLQYWYYALRRGITSTLPSGVSSTLAPPFRGVKSFFAHRTTGASAAARAAVEVRTAINAAVVFFMPLFYHISAEQETRTSRK